MSRLPPTAPSARGVTTETVTKTTYTETTVKRVTNNVAVPAAEDVTLVKSGGPLGLSIIGGSDHSCVPFGTGEPGIFISKVGRSVGSGMTHMLSLIFPLRCTNIQ